MSEFYGKSAPQATTGPTPKPVETTHTNLLEIDIKDENTALNVMVGFLGLAQKRGCFAINESAKIFECVKQFRSDDLSK
ncbi:MAG: hypothetical protein CL685_00770 [Candidatus Magasanikbacteria bacterium]|nr:hypothetical protein [Candidatus Magasanikbacteria bacterium]